MISSKVFFILSVLAAVAYGKWVKITNKRSTAIITAVDGTDYTLEGYKSVSLNLTENWTGSITAIPEGAEIVDGPKTEVELSFSSTGDMYSISLVNGFNLPVKVAPVGSNCQATVCAANILRLCPLDNQIINSAGVVVACESSPLIMATLCPLAVVDDLTSTNVRTCTTAKSYVVIFI